MFKNKKGFSLVELIVVIAILAVLVAVLAPSLIRYTENSRAQKDVSAMDELVNAVQLALANDKCYDEALEYSVENNFITYTDSSAEYGTQMADEEFYAPDGSGKATTITFNPESREDGKTIYRLSNAFVNDMTYGNGSVSNNRDMSGAHTENNQCYFSEMEQLYNAVRLTVGDTITPTSTTYRNSSYTVFIVFSQKDGITVAEVYGSFNGTNLHDGCLAAVGSLTETYDEDGTPNQTGTPGETTEAEYADTNFAGMVEMPSYKADSYAENLQKTGDWGYYSDFLVAWDDAFCGQIGANANAQQKDAAVAVSLNKYGAPVIVLMKDLTITEDAEPVCYATDMELILNGHVLAFNNSHTCFAATANAKLTINGSASGSKIIAKPNHDVFAIIQVTYFSSVDIIGGEYELVCDGNCASDQTFLVYAEEYSKVYVKDATFNVIDNHADVGSDVQAFKIVNRASLTINDSAVNVQTESGNAQAVYSVGGYIYGTNTKFTVQSSKQASIFHVNFHYKGSTYLSSAIKMTNCTFDGSNSVSGNRWVITHTKHDTMSVNPNFKNCKYKSISSEMHLIDA